MKETIVFILAFLCTNFIIFMPIWLVAQFLRTESQNKAFDYKSPYFFLKKIFYIRFTNDFFRLNLEIQILALILLLGGNGVVPFLKPIFIAMALLAFIYIGYVSIIMQVFKKDPILISDLNFARTGLLVYKKSAYLTILVLIFLLTGLYLSFDFLINLLKPSALSSPHKWSLVVILSISILLSFHSIIKVPYKIYIRSVSFSLINHLSKNLKKGLLLKSSLKNLSNEFPYAYFNELELAKRPNVLFVFLESYGSFAFSNEQYGKSLRKKLNGINGSLNQKKWKTVSTFSESPILGGGSWLSHSSILFGTKVGEIAAHEVIFGHSEYVTKLDSLPNFFNSQGYKTTMTTTFSYDKNEVNWEKLQNAYPYQELMLIDDFNYVGKKVPLFGIRHSIPDEYTLNYAFRSVSSNIPYFLTVSTVNSHYDFVSPIHAQENWEDYNTKDFDLTEGSKKNNLKNYFSAINYHFDYLHKFLLNDGLDDDTLLVLIGDHQPPIIVPSTIDKYTPIHVISKNADFINAFKEFNYSEGLIPKTKDQKHESFLSKFMLALNKAFGKNKEMDLPIYEDGTKLY